MSSSLGGMRAQAPRDNDSRARIKLSVPVPALASHSRDRQLTHTRVEDSSGKDRSGEEGAPLAVAAKAGLWLVGRGMVGTDIAC